MHDFAEHYCCFSPSDLLVTKVWICPIAFFVQSSIGACAVEQEESPFPGHQRPDTAQVVASSEWSQGLFFDDGNDEIGESGNDRRQLTETSEVHETSEDA